MRRIVIAIVAVLAILFIVRGAPRVAFSGFLPLVAAGTIAVLLDRWASGRGSREKTDGHQRHDPAHANDDLEGLAHDLDRTARNLEKRLEALETILLDRTRTPL